MMESMTEIMNKGTKCLTEQMGIIEAWAMRSGFKERASAAMN